MQDQTRNLNPTPAAKVAMIIWGDKYSKQHGGSMDFWDRLTADQKSRCELVARQQAVSICSEIIKHGANHNPDNFDAPYNYLVRVVADVQDKRK